MLNFKNTAMVLTFITGCVVSVKVQADVWVGGDASCDYSTIQAAIDFVETGTENTIRIANNVPNETYFENLSFDNSGVTGAFTMIGGYTQCQGQSIEFPVIIDGSGTAPVFNIFGDDTQKSIGLHKLTLKNGFYDGVTERAGGLNIFGDSMNVFLNEITINQNTGILGGGLYSQGSDQDVYLNSVNLINNTARNGGGFACDESTVFMRSPSAVSFNSALSGLSGEGNGGGAYLSSGCYLAVQSGDDSVAGIQGVVGNQASNHGGGIYLQSSSRLNVSKRDGIEPTIKDNQADSDINGTGNGGGIYATGTNTTVDFRHGQLTNNQAANGGGAASNDLARLDLFQSSSSCNKDQTCTTVSGNQAGKNLSGIDLGAGGAFYASNGGIVFVTRSAVTDNMADSGLVAAVNSGGYISIRSSFITNNGDISNNDFNNNYLMVAVDDDSRINLGNVTVADNDISSGSDHIILAALGARFQTEFSIFQDDSAQILETFNDSGQATFIEFDCTVLHEIQSISGVDIDNANIESTAVDFVDAGSGDYHIQATSVAVDLCRDSISWPLDVDGDMWAYDDLNVPNVGGAFDAGADETYSSDIIFKDGFN